MAPAPRRPSPTVNAGAVAGGRSFGTIDAMRWYQWFGELALDGPRCDARATRLHPGPAPRQGLTPLPFVLPRSRAAGPLDEGGLRKGNESRDRRPIPCATHGSSGPARSCLRSVLRPVPLTAAGARPWLWRAGNLCPAFSTAATTALLVVVGPCSVHDPVAALDYAGRLVPVAGALRADLWSSSGSTSRSPGRRSDGRV